MTVRQAEDIPFERIQKTRQTTEEKRAEKEDLKSALAGSDKSAVVGRSVAAPMTGTLSSVCCRWRRAAHALAAPEAPKGAPRCMHETAALMLALLRCSDQSQ